MFDNLTYYIDRINQIVWGTPTVMLLFLTGVFFTVKLGFFQFSKFRLWFSETVLALFKNKEMRQTCDKKNVSQLQALSTALAGTIGTGNITGVAAALSLGGPGAVFWMWISAIFGMMTAFAENVLGIYFRRKSTDGQWSGGPMFYIKNGLENTVHLKKGAKPLAVLYAIFLALASFGMGNMAQTNTISDSISSTFGVSVFAVGLICAFITAVIISGGISRIGSFTEKLVPLMALAYIICSLYIFISNYKSIPYVFSSIFSCAFTSESVLGGLIGTAVKSAVSVGMRRGVFSNEAGLGSSVCVGSCSSVTEPVKQGMWGIFQVFFDTLIICTITAFILLSATVEAVPLDMALKNISGTPQYVNINTDTHIKEKVYITDTKPNPIPIITESGKKYGVCHNGKNYFVNISHSDEYTYANILSLKGQFDENENLENIILEPIEGAFLVTVAFKECFGFYGSVILTLCIVLFAFSTVIGWSFYGSKGIEFLFGQKGVKIYKTMYPAVVFLGAVTELSVVWGISDIFNGLMAIPNLIALTVLSKTVIKITSNYLNRRKGYDIRPIINFYEDDSLLDEL